MHHFDDAFSTVGPDLLDDAVRAVGRLGVDPCPARPRRGCTVTAVM